MSTPKALRSRWRGDLNKEIVSRTGSSWADGALAAANLAGEYNASSSHPYDLTDCILGKLNLLTKKVRKNPYGPRMELISVVTSMGSYKFSRVPHNSPIVWLTVPNTDEEEGGRVMHGLSMATAKELLVQLRKAVRKPKGSKR